MSIPCPAYFSEMTHCPLTSIFQSPNPVKTSSGRIWRCLRKAALIWIGEHLQVIPFEARFWPLSRKPTGLIWRILVLSFPGKSNFWAQLEYAVVGRIFLELNSIYNAHFIWVYLELSGFYGVRLSSQMLGATGVI